MSCPIKKALEEDLIKARSNSGISDGNHRSCHNNSKFPTEASYTVTTKGIQKSFSECTSESKFTPTPTNSLPSSPAKSALRKVSYCSGSPNLSPGRKVSPPHTSHVTFYGQSEDGSGKAGDDSPESSNFGSTECSPRRRKISNISTASSVGSELDSDGSGERKVDLKSLVEGVGTVIIPA
ncbi:unnamed protein product, partial [Candidula unifasciata]